jgi:DNA-binding winged helix-turn-helix (wHTH) protein
VIENRERVVSKEDLIAAIWHGRTVSESALTTCINAARTAIGDSGEAQRLIKTFPFCPSMANRSLSTRTVPEVVTGD